MNRNSYLLLFSLLIALWGCPTKKLVPDPTPPQPQVQPQQQQQLQPQQPKTQGDQAQMAYDWIEVLHILKGMAPLVGPAPFFFQMMA